MLPKQLILSAFGPYSEEVSIAFDPFMEQGLFLITGPTGAGKTMLFDAIVFALYGTTSGGKRTAQQLRCDQAKATTKTYVSLTFLLHQEEYCITRSPTYYIPSKKTPKQTNATITLPNGEIIEGIKEVNHKVIALLGIDDKQFKQIAMIAQGQFTKLIYASSDEREKVLRNLFSTKPYQDLEETLKQKAKSLQDEYTILVKQRELMLQKITDDALDTSVSCLQQLVQEQEKEVRQKQAEITNLRKVIDDCKEQCIQQKIINQKIEELDRVKERLHQATNKREYYVQQERHIGTLKQAKQIQPTYEKKVLLQQQYKQIRQEVADCQRQSIQVEQQYKEIQKEFMQIPSLQEEKEQMVREQETWMQQKEAWLEYHKVLVNKQTLLKKLRKQEQILQSKRENINGMQEKLVADDQKISEIPQKQLTFATLQKEIDIAKQQKEVLQNLEQALVKQSVMEKEYQKKAKQYQQIEEQYESAKKRYEQQVRLYEYEQAGLLASNLQPNHPCPVCGSLDHPNIATFSSVTFDYQTVQRKKEALEKQQLQKQEQYQALTLSYQELQWVEADIKKIGQECNLDSLTKNALQDQKNQIQLYIDQKQAHLVQIHTDITNLEQVSLTMDTRKKELAFLQEQCSQQEKIHQDIQSQLHVTEGKLSTYSLDATVTMEEIDSTMQSLQKKVQMLQQRIQDTEQRHATCQEDMWTMQSTRETLDKQCSKIQQEMTNMDAQLEREMAQCNISLDVFMSVLDTLSQLETMEEQLQIYHVTQERLLQQSEQLQAAIGTKQKIDTNILEENIQSLLQKEKQYIEESDHVRSQTLHFQQILKDIESIDHSVTRIQNQLQKYRHLSDITTGKNAYRISFERYVLAAYFENILVYANILLQKMSQGRYQLFRRDNRSKGSGKQGLELDVLDVESGLLRDVTTLSGGESFKAALSLALGMSQMIQSFAGGIELQTLFIDEGFGSLDSQSLDQAIACLMDLQQDHKMIGIISHVSELQERIDNKLRITRNHQESKIYTVVG